MYKKDKTIFAICDGNLVMYSQNMELNEMSSNQIKILCSEFEIGTCKMNDAQMFVMFVKNYAYYKKCFTQIYKSF